MRNLHSIPQRQTIEVFFRPDAPQWSTNFWDGRYAEQVEGRFLNNDARARDLYEQAVRIADEARQYLLQTEARARNYDSQYGYYNLNRDRRG